MNKTKNTKEHEFEDVLLVEAVDAEQNGKLVYGLKIFSKYEETLLSHADTEELLKQFRQFIVDGEYTDVSFSFRNMDDTLLVTRFLLERRRYK